jgi:CarD family transcriptional regulator
MSSEIELVTDEQAWPLPDPGGPTPDAWVVPPDPDCAVGGQLFDPRHGVVVVERVESRERDGRATEYLTLSVPGQQMVLLVPAETIGAGGLRRVITAEEASAVLEELQSEPAAMPTWTAQGFVKVRRRVLSRNPLVVAGAVRDLAAKAVGKGLGPTDRQLFETGAGLLASELGVALGVGTERARRLIGTMTGHSPTRGLPAVERSTRSA